MTKKLIKQLIKHYNDTIVMIERLDRKPGVWEEVYTILNERSVHIGICNCASEIFDIDLYCDNWVLNFKMGIDEHYWFQLPKEASSRPKAIQLLRKRVERMETFLTQ